MGGKRKRGGIFGDALPQYGDAASHQIDHLLHMNSSRPPPFIFWAGTIRLPSPASLILHSLPSHLYGLSTDLDMSKDIIL